MWGEKPKLFLSECYQFAVASPHALKFPKFSFCPTEELTYLLCLFFSLPPQQTSVAIFKGRKYLVNSSWLITPRNYFKALQFSRAHCVPAESSPLGSQIILKSLTGKVVLNNLLFCTSCSNHLYLKKKIFHWTLAPAPITFKTTYGTCLRAWMLFLVIYLCWKDQKISNVD